MDPASYGAAAVAAARKAGAYFSVKGPIFSMALLIDQVPADAHCHRLT
jgi:hypothetical protein